MPQKRFRCPSTPLSGLMGALSSAGVGLLNKAFSFRERRLDVSFKESGRLCPPAPQGVNPPAPHDLPVCEETYLPASISGCGIIRLVLRTPFVTILLILSVTTPAAAPTTPFTGWADGRRRRGRGARRRRPGGGAARPSRAALGPVTSGEAGARARLLSARALELDRRPAEAADRARAPRFLHYPSHSSRPRGPAAPRPWPPPDAPPRRPPPSRSPPPGPTRPTAPALAAAEARAWLAAGEPGRGRRAPPPGRRRGDPAARLVLGPRLARRSATRAPPPRCATLALERAGEPEGEEAAASAARCARPAPSPLARPHRPGAPPPRRHPDRGGARGDRRHRRRRLGPAPLPAVLRAMALLQLGRPAEAERIAAPVARLPGPGEPAAARYVLARAAARQGRIDEAVARYRQVAPGAARRSRAHRRPAGRPRRRRRLPGRLAPLRRRALSPRSAARPPGASLRERPGARRAPDARWFLGLVAPPLRGPPAAREPRSADLAAQGDRATSARRRSTGRRASSPTREAAAALYRGAVAEVPGRLVRAALGRPPRGSSRPPLPAAAPAPADPAPRPARDPRVAAALSLAVDLAGAGLREESAALLQRLSRGPDVRTRASAPRRGGRLHRRRRGPLPHGPGPPARPASGPGAGPTPTPTPTSSGRPRGALGVDPALALAVMRRESAFVASARSGAGGGGAPPAPPGDGPTA